jgi:hypothetical protein
MELYEDDRYEDDYEMEDYDRPGRYSRYESDEVSHPRVRLRSPLRNAESLEELNVRRLVLESELALITKKTSEISPDVDAESGYTDEDGTRISGLVPSEKSTLLIEWFSSAIPANEARRLRTCFTPQLEGQKNPSVLCPKLDMTFVKDLKGKKPNERWETDLKAIQNKFTDIIRPLLYLWTVAPAGEGNQVTQAIEDSVRLWCNANLYLTTARRKNVLKATDPAFLQDRSLFHADHRNSLFGPTFYDAIVKSCRDDEARRRARPRGG